MTIVGHGIDLVEVARIAALVEAHGERFLSRCFTAGEREYARDKRRATEHLAARFAAKEAVLKALGTGLSDGIEWVEVEVVPLTSPRAGGSAAPGVRLHGRAAQIAGQRGITGWHLSLSHTETHAIASAIAIGA